MHPVMDIDFAFGPLYNVSGVALKICSMSFGREGRRVPSATLLLVARIDGGKYLELTCL